MDQIQEVKNELNARSTATTVEELQRRGRKQIKVLKAEHIAGLISESVQRAVEKSGLLGQDEVDRLVDESREEFRAVVKQRQQEAECAGQVQDDLAQAQAELQELRSQLEQSSHRADELRTALDEAQQNLDEAMSEAQQAKDELAEMQKQIEQAQQHAVPDNGQPADAGQGGGMNAELMFRLMNELADMKAAMSQGTAAQPAAATPDMSEAIQQLAGTLNERLEKFGRKIGISSAVDAADVKFDNLFKDDGPELESNMADVKVTKRTGAGIAGNLEKLKKLKGGG